MRSTLLPRAGIVDVLRGRARLVGARCDETAERGWVSPIEPRLLLGIPYGDLAAEEARYLARRTWQTDAGVLFRAGFARALAPSRSAPSVPRPWIVSARVDNLTIEEAMRRIFLEAEADRARMIHFVHPHALNLAAFDTRLAEHLARADLVLPDGIGIRIAARLLGVGMRHNLNGTDLWPELIRIAEDKALPVALVGGEPGVAETSAERFRRECPRLKIAFVSHGFLDDDESSEVARRIGRAERCLVLVGMGTPRQEEWAWRYLKNVAGAIVVTVGGLFDFVSERLPRAPVAWRELGMEWLFRLRLDPRRQGVRYLLGNLPFLLAAQRPRLG